jgi:nitroreductase
MDTLDAIFNRRSIRKYLSKEIPEELINTLLNASMYAPSARNTQSWEYLVVLERKLLNDIMKIHPYSGMLKDAPLAILVCGNKKLEENEAYLNQNCSAATQNILLAAYALGLGTVWLGVYPRKERVDGLRKLFSLPEHIVPVSMIAVGYPDEFKPKPERFLPERIHYNAW